MADSWRDKMDKTSRNSQAINSMVPGTLGGRIKQASPVRRLPPKIDQDPVDTDPYVGTEEPEEAPNGKIWFNPDLAGA